MPTIPPHLKDEWDTLEQNLHNAEKALDAAQRNIRAFVNNHDLNNKKQYKIIVYKDTTNGKREILFESEPMLHSQAKHLIPFVIHDSSSTLELEEVNANNQ